MNSCYLLEKELGVTLWDPKNKYSFKNKELEDIFKYETEFLLSDEQIFNANMYFMVTNIIDKNTYPLSYEHFLKHSAMIGHPGAQYQLAKQIGFKNPTESGKFMHQSAAQGHPKALYELSIAYRSIPELYNIKPNSKISELLLEEAVCLGDSQAVSNKAVSSLFETQEIKESLEKINELANSGNAFARKFIEDTDINDMSSEELKEFVDRE